MDTTLVDQTAGRTSAVPRERASRGLLCLVLGGFLLVYVALNVSAAGRRSATFDEPLHLAAGYTALVDRDYRVDPTHPPFARMWAALPLLFTDVRGMDTSAIDDAAAGEWLLHNVAASRRFLYAQDDAGQVLFLARLGVVFWGAVLGCFVFVWARQWLGFGPAVGALAFYVLSPNLLGHASLVTTDLPVACFMFAATFFLWRVSARPALPSAIGLAVSVALAVTTKFSGLLLGPVLLIALGLSVRRGGPLTWRHVGALLVGTFVVSFAAIWATYGFRYEPSHTAGWVFHLQDTRLVADHAHAIASVAAWIDAHHLLPNAFTQGVMIGIAASRTQAMYLLGEISTRGWWYYFPLAFLIKTPVALMILWAVGLWAGARQWRRSAPDSPVLSMLVASAVVLSAAMLSGVNIGVRHILPIYPFVALLAAGGAAFLWTARPPASRVILGGLSVVLCAEFAFAYPHTLTFFNAVVGGQARGLRYLADSNIDWGQDLYLVKRWKTRNHIDHVNLAYFGTADPQYYGINATLLPGTPRFDDVTIEKPRLPGYVAISLNMLSGQYLPPEWRLYYREFRNRKPDAVLGSTIRVYWVDSWPEPAPARSASDDIEVVRALARGLAGISAYRHSALHYREILARRPNDARALAGLGVVLVEAGQVDEGLRSLRIAVDLAPGDAQIRHDQGIALLTSGHMDQAAARAEAWVQLTPSDHRAHYLLAIVREAQGRSEEAADELTVALRINPSFAPARQAFDVLRPRP